MAMGKPVVVTRSRGQVDLVREGETGLYVPPGDPAALERVLGDPAALRAALERVLDNSVAHVARIVRAPS
jgi:glycosyltransferase involved in cell wall biosynthesis